jgi:hypothetical protein
MPNWNDPAFDEDETGENENGPKALRARLKALEKENRELKESNTTLTKQVRTRSVGDLVKAKGYNPKVAALIPSDVDVSEDAITKWLDEYADVFSLKKTEEVKTPAVEAEDDSSDEGVVEDEVQAAMNAINNASHGALTPTRQADLLRQINDPNLTQDAFMDLLRKNGAKV